MENAIVPQSYEAWHHCITVECGLNLRPDFIKERIESLQDDKDFRTQQFIRLYGQPHRQAVLNWFKQAQNSL